MAFIWPFPREKINFISYFGHSGIDWEGSEIGGAGTPIVAVGPGVVVSATGNTSWHGNSVIIDHGVIDGIRITSLYAHMRDTPAVNVGDAVDAGTFLGVVGSTGQSTGAHLHLEIIFDGQRLPTDTPGNNTPGLGFTRTLEWMDAHVGTDPPDPPNPYQGTRRPGWLNRPPTLYYRTW